MQPTQSLESIKADFFSSDTKVATAASDKLSEIGGDEVVAFLIPILDSENAWLRNSTALVLRDIGDGRAMEPLLQAIQKPQNANNRGTLVYALEKFDCSQKLSELFDILFYARYEAKMSAAAILDEQIFEFSTEDLHEIQRKWNDLQQHPEKCPDFAACKDDIQNFVEGFVSYLI